MRRLRHCRFKSLFIIIGMTCSFLLLLYQFDNKYTHFSPQAINGTLYVEEGDLDKYPIRFLKHGWLLYPDILLTPEELKQNPPDYVEDVSIGQHTSFALGRSFRSVHGNGTYVMTLYFPKSPQTYALELPEIFSAYRLYINDSLLLQMGNPEPSAYQDKIQTRKILFEASGKTTLMLAVSDYSHFYSGLLYAPALGSPDSIDLMRQLRIGSALFILPLALMISVFAFYFAYHIKEKRVNAGIFSLLSLTLAGYTSYPIIHGVFALSIQPWYTLELFCGYLLTFLVTYLHNEFCKPGKLPTLLSNLFTSTFCVIALLYSLFSSYLTFQVVQIFSVAVESYHLLLTLYLLFTAWQHLSTHRLGPRLLFYADVIFALTLGFNILFPVYEPIWGSYFTEWGGLFLVVALGYILWQEIITGYKNSFLISQQQRHTERLLAMQKDYLKSINEKIEETHRLRHDFRQHLRIMAELTHQDKSNELLDYMSKITHLGSKSTILCFTEHAELNAMLHYYHQLATEHQIQFEIQLQIPAELNFPAIDLCTILGNLIENAIEACMRQVLKPRQVFLEGALISGKLIFVLENSFEGSVQMKGNQFVSSKRDSIGIGIESIRAMVKQHNGLIQISHQENLFLVEFSLPTF